MVRFYGIAFAACTLAAAAGHAIADPPSGGVGQGGPSPDQNSAGSDGAVKPGPVTPGSLGRLPGGARPVEATSEAEGPAGAPGRGKG
jgi:hypothetical protein